MACVEGGSLREMERSAWRSRTADCGPQDEEDGFRKNLRGFGRAEDVGEGSSLLFTFVRSKRKSIGGRYKSEEQEVPGTFSSSLFNF